MAGKAEEVIKIKVKLTKNIKYGNTPYKMGQTIEINEEDKEEFIAAGAIEVKEEEAKVE